MPEVDDVEVNINPEDVEMKTARASGAGGVVHQCSGIKLKYLWWWWWCSDVLCCMIVLGSGIGWLKCLLCFM